MRNDVSLELGVSSRGPSNARKSCLHAHGNLHVQHETLKRGENGPDIQKNIEGPGYGGHLLGDMATRCKSKSQAYT
jgi:hypothetical protein